MGLRYLNTQNIKAKMKDKGLRTSAGFLEAFDREIDGLLAKYARVADADRVKTVMAIHISLPDQIRALARGLRR